MRDKKNISIFISGLLLSCAAQGAVINATVVEGVASTNEIVIPTGFIGVVKAVNVAGAVDDTINGITFVADNYVSGSGGTGYSTTATPEGSSQLPEAVFSTTTANLGDSHVITGDTITGLSADTDYALELFFSDNHSGRSSDVWYSIGSESGSVAFAQNNGVVNRVRVEFNTGSDTAFDWTISNNTIDGGGTHAKFSGYAFYTSSSAGFISADVSAIPTSGGVPLEVVFSGSGSSSSTNIISYSWDFGDGNSSSGMLVTNTYSAVGDYTATLVVEDANGLMDTKTIDISAIHFATAVATATPTSGDVPLEVAFDGSGSSSSTNIVSYDWDFGDGNADSGMLVTNIYASGIYTATLVIEDANGLMDTNTVNITATKAVTAEYVQSSQTYATAEMPTFSTEDLAQTEYLSSSATGGNESDQHAQLFNGLLGNQDGDTNDDGEVRLTSGEAITVTFDTSVNENGYDINLIETIAGWTSTEYSATLTNNLTRANQGYEIRVTFADGSLGIFAPAEHWEPNGEATWTNSVDPETDVNDKYWTKVSFTNAVGSDAMLRNVKSLTFDISEDALPGSVVIYREIDVFGVPSGVMLPTEIVISYGGDSSSLSWASDSTYSYQVQSSLSLTVPDWNTFTNVTGTPPETSVDLPAKDQGAEFYRVIAE